MTSIFDVIGTILLPIFIWLVILLLAPFIFYFFEWWLDFLDRKIF